MSQWNATDPQAPWWVPGGCCRSWMVMYPPGICYHNILANEVSATGKSSTCQKVPETVDVNSQEGTIA